MKVLNSYKYQRDRSNSMKQIWNSFRLAFSMYSIIPARQIDKTKENTKYILCFVPWVGAVIAFLITERCV